MPRYSIEDIARIWIRNGGDQRYGKLLYTCEIAMAESGGNSDAIGPAGDYGLWQINRINFAHFGVNSFTVLNPDTNARIAIAMSSNAYNWAAWCTAWADPVPHCGHGFLPGPQPGSAASQWVDAVTEALNAAGFVLHGGGPFVAPTPHLAGVTGAWADIQNYAAHGAPAQAANLADLSNALRRM